MVCCCAFGCSNQSSGAKANKSISFHSFPDRAQSPERHKRWVANIRRDQFAPTKYSKLCSEHFEEEMFDRTGQTTRLRRHAIPTKFNFPEHLLSTPERKRQVLQRVFPMETSDSEEEPPQPTSSATRLQTADNSSRNSVPEILPTSPAITGTASSDTGTALPGPSKTFPLYFSGPVKVKKSKDSEASADEHSYSITESREELKRKLDKSVKLTMQLRTQLKTSHQRARRLKVKVTALTLMIDSLRNREAEILRLFKMDSAKCLNYKAEILKEAD